MEIMVIVIVIVVLIGGGYWCYKFLLKYIERQLRHENEILKREVEYYKSENGKLKEAQSYWSSYATGAAQFNQQIVQNHNQNLGTTLSAVVQILQGLQQNPNSNLSTEERLRVEQIIQQASAINPLRN